MKATHRRGDAGRGEWLRAVVAACLVWGLTAVEPLQAIDTLVVGTGDHDWEAVRESSRHVAVAAESIWTWRAEAGDNLARDVAARGGAVRVYVAPTMPFQMALVRRPGLESWVDGDAGTAWGPEEDGQVDREAEFYIDLGGTFRVDELRFYPRLDREHRMAFLGAFEVATHDGVFDGPYSADLPRRLQYRPVISYSSVFPHREPIAERWFPSREVRFIRLLSRQVEAWEIAEVEVRGDGTIPAGEYVSQPLYVRGGYPIWGRVTTDAGELTSQAISVYTRTGPDPEPLHYFLKLGDQVEQVSQEEWEEAADGASGAEQGPVRPNPAWSLWQAVAEGQVQSPSPSRYLQFRVVLREQGSRLQRLGFEYIKRPLATDLAAEIAPAVVEVAEETAFTLSMEVHIDADRGDAGFRYLEVLTPAAVAGVDEVLVDDEPVIHTALIRPGQGITIDTWERLLLPGSFVQVRFRAAVYRDGTPFRVRVMDYFPRGEEVEFVYQTAREADVDAASAGGNLVVRLASDRVPLLGEVASTGAVFTPNGDGVNDVFAVSFSVTKLTVPAPLRLGIFDLGGRPIRGLPAEEVGLGRQQVRWDGRDAAGRLVPPGLYLYRLELATDAETTTRWGHVQVAY